MAQVGACIVNDEQKIVGIGYNGMPNGCRDDKLPWGKTDDDPLKTKYAFGGAFKANLSSISPFLQCATRR